MSDPLLIARNASAQCFLLPELTNRHGLITGATGSGKTVTLQTMAQSLSRIGVPVFMADVKGDLTGMSQAGKLSDKMAAVLPPLSLPGRQQNKVAARWTAYWEAAHAVDKHETK
jgi:DNA helicase HerA-like ATPase